MSKSFLLPVFLCLIAVPAYAQDKNDAAPKKPAAAKEQKAAPAEESDAAPASDEKSPEKSNIDWVDVESTGTLSSAKEGALEKTIWKEQPRSLIELLIAKLPTNPNLRSVLSLQRRVLLSKTDASLIQNDVGVLRGNDLLIQRINKLMDMGLYDDAWELYTKRADTVYDVSIAQMGMMLLVMKNDLATACLEEKVFSAKYPKDKFFATLDKACVQTLGGSAAPKFPDSAVLDAVYNKPDYSVSAKDTGALTKMSDLERALVLANGKIRYDGVGADNIASTPAVLLTYFLMDKKLPDATKALIKAEADKRGLTWYTPSIARDEEWAKAKAIKDVPSQWPYVESALKGSLNSADIGIYYGEMLAAAKPENLSTDTLEKALNVFLASGKALPEFWLNAAQKAAPQNPLFYIYLQAFGSLTPTQGATPKVGEFQNAAKSLKSADFDQILAIIESLDKQAAILNNPLIVYEKHLSLTEHGDYVMPTVGLNVLLETAPERKQIGITVLAVLNSLAAKPDNMYSGTVRKSLYSMLNVGLIEDAKLIGAETVASVLNRY